MNLKRKKDFAEAIGVTTSYVTTMISRGQLFAVENKNDGKDWIDLDHAITRAYLKKRKARGLMPTKKEPEPDFDIPEKETIDVDMSGASELESLTEREQKAKVEKLEHQVQIERMKKEKMAGETIPTEIVRQLFSQHFKSVALKFHEEAAKLASITVKNLGGDREDIADFESRLEFSINEAIEESKELTMSSLSFVVSEYQEKRGKGERK